MAITRTHFAYRIDLWTDDEKEVVEHLADVDGLTVALATFHAAIERQPGRAITLRQGRHVIEDSRRLWLATLFSFPWSDKPPPEGQAVQGHLATLVGLAPLALLPRHKQSTRSSMREFQNLDRREYFSDL